MNIVFFAHPAFLDHQSMPRFTRLLANGMQERGHTVEVWAPLPTFWRLPVPRAFKKWLGYIDQYVVFPLEVRKRLKRCPSNTLFAFTDHALGPWVPLVADREHVIHCHDFLAQRSALGEIPENTTGRFGQIYQRYIRQGYSQGKNFISVSYKTSEDLHAFAPAPLSSRVVYNGLNQTFKPRDPAQARTLLSTRVGLNLGSGYLLHVGGNHWYKNRLGIIELYDAWREMGGNSLPLLLIGEAPSPALLSKQQASKYKEDIYFLSGIEDTYVQLAYTGASVFLFPSIAEGFGWPIAEAMASGCPVITTNEVPMTEVAGEAGFFIARRPHDEHLHAEWAQEGAKVIHKVVGLTPEERKAAIEAGFASAKRFDPDIALDKIEEVYLGIMNEPKVEKVVRPEYSMAVPVEHEH